MLVELVRRNRSYRRFFENQPIDRKLLEGEHYVPKRSLKELIVECSEHGA